MRLIVEKLVVFLAVLGGALLLMGSTVLPPVAPPSRIIWSEDGNQVIFSTPFQGVFVVDATGRWLRSIPEHAPIGDSDDLGNSAPALSPDGTRVAYITYDKYDEYDLERDIPLSSDGILGIGPIDFLPVRFLFQMLFAAFSSPEVTAAIETATLDGTSVRRLTVYKDLDGDGEVDRHNEVDPVWSPDGNHIVFKSDRSSFSSGSVSSDSGLHLSIMNADGSDVRVLAPSVRLLTDWSPWRHSRSRHPKWSPDGRWIAFTGWEKSGWPGQQQVIYTVQPDGTGLTRIARIHSYGFLEWSPDSTRLAFVAPERSEIEGNRGAIYTVRPDGSELTKISNVLLPKQDPGFQRIRFSAIDNLAVWSPDGAWLAFSRADQEGSGVFVARPDGTEIRLVIPGKSGAVSWAPDGTELYIADMEYAVRPDGSGLRPLLTDQVRGPNRWTLTAWSPDGSRLAVLELLEGPKFERTLFTVARDGTEKRVLVHGVKKRLVAAQSGWYESPENLSACEDGYVVPEPDANPGLVQDCRTLLEARDRLIGGAYVNWSMSRPIEAWDGIEVGCPSPLQVFGIAAWQGIDIWCPSSHRVIGLRLKGMTGAIPPGLKKLAGLKTLDLADGRLSGGIPPELGSLTNLRELRLYRTSIDGEIPPELGRLSNLRVLSLNRNSLRGGIPPELGNLASLEELSLWLNKMSGIIPPELGNLSKLELLNFGLNRLSGTIPSELGNLSRLKVLSLPFNHEISGEIPPTLGSLTNLKVLNLSGNNLTGKIPPGLGNLGDLEELYLSGNSLAGNIPPDLGQLTNLQTLLLSGNELTGTIPSVLGNLTSLWALDLSYNSLSGCIPATLSSQLKELRSDDLKYCVE